MDGSHPPFRNARGDMRKSFNFYLDFSFWSARNDHFWLWAAIYFQPLASTCEMLNISHKQTTAYHPESNGAVERLHRCLKNTLCTHAVVATWSEELPFVLLGLRAQPRKDTGLSPAEAVFGALIVLSNEFLQNDELSVDTIAKKISKTLHVSAPSLPRHNSSTYLPSELLAELLSAPLVWVHRGGLVPPLQPLYDGPYVVLCRSPRSFTIRVGSHPGSLATTKRVSFSDRWFLRLLLPRRHPTTVPEPFSYPVKKFLHARDQRRLHSLHRHSTHPVSGHRPRGWTSDLFSSQPRPELVVSPVESCLCPRRRSNQSSVL